MGMIADLHIHSRFARACSKDITIKNLEKWAKIKGIDLLGTGDFTHPEWLKELKTELKEDEAGVFRTKTGFPFLLQVEISQMYSAGGKGRRVHNVLLAPNFEVVDQMREYFLKFGRLDYDGRPIFKIPCPDLVEAMRSISKDIEIIPAHAWTPWFSVFGSKSGFDSVEEAFEDQAKHIHAIETGLSSDPPMNRSISHLDKYNLVSFSDAHSFWPWRLGREATIFDVELNYKNILNAIRDGKGIKETIEVDPNYGKYHVDGHRACNIVMEPSESNKHKGICPVCKRPLTIGVLNRVEELTDQKPPKKIKPSYKSLLPLTEIISHVIGGGLATKKVWAMYWNFIKAFGNEYKVLLEAPLEELKKIDPKVADAVIKNRNGQIKITPGYDGVYGIPNIGNAKPKETKVKKAPQKGLSDFIP